MPDYRYTAQTKNGKQIKGRIKASDEREIRKLISSKDQTLLYYEEVAKQIALKPLKKSQLSDFCRQMGELIKSGISILRALEIQGSDESITPYEKELYMRLRDRVVQGIALSTAMEELYPAFPPLLVYMFRAAESSGNLDSTSLRLADQYQKENHLESEAKNALTYPKILAALIVGVVGIIFGFIMPQFEELFNEMPVLPAPTRFLLGVSDFVRNYWYLLLVFAVLIWIFGGIVSRIPSVRLVIDRFKVRGPLGKLQQVIYSARFARTMSSLYSAGIPIDQCLAIARQTIGNSYIEHQFNDVIKAVQAGGLLSDALDNVDGFVSKLSSVVRVGEETGSLDSMLVSVADNLDFASEQALTRMVKYIEPVMIVIMAVIVGFIMIGVILPIYQSYSTIGAGQ
ncbi:MAG: type II secretion system F family protein [Lachnospiraceae bacterium]|nr:type II secretion system F family protein [Lachnospiraceae bacterium]